MLNDNISNWKEYFCAWSSIIFWSTKYFNSSSKSLSPLTWNECTGQPYSHLAEACVMYIPWDSLLVSHLPTSWLPAWCPVTVLHIHVSAEVEWRIWSGDLPLKTLTCHSATSNRLFTVRNSSCNVFTSVFQEFCPEESRCTPPTHMPSRWTHTPLDTHTLDTPTSGRHLPRQPSWTHTHTPRRPLQRTVRISLECILVLLVYLTKFLAQKHVQKPIILSIIQQQVIRKPKRTFNLSTSWSLLVHLN